MTAAAGGCGLVAAGRSFRFRALLVLTLLLLCVAAYAGVARNDFLRYDDREFVTENPHVRTGLTGESILWNFRHGTAKNWVPLSFVSHGLDVTLFGLDPRGHHLVNLLFHAASAVLLFLVLAAFTGWVWPSFAVSVLFAVHPLHVESVAWVAERRDVLSALFFLLALSAYRRYVQRPGFGPYLALCLFFSLGLLAKPMLVTLPVLLLLLDYWPLGRLPLPGSAVRAAPPAPRLAALIIEKLPLAALAAADAAITIAVQSRDGAVSTLAGIPLDQRFSNAAVATALYLRKWLWPADLAIFYPHPLGTLPLAEVLLACALLLSVTGAALVLRARKPYLLMGWLWYLLMLAPVAGIIQVGKQAMADRYTYLPLIGIGIALVWGLAEFAKRAGGRTLAAGAAGLVLTGIMVVMTRRQVETWRSDRTVFEHAARVTEKNALAAMVLGDLHLEEGNVPEALDQLRKAALFDSRDDQIRVHLGVALRESGQAAAALASFREALRLNPGNIEALNNLAELLTFLEQPSEAIAILATAIARAPATPELHYNRGNALGALNRHTEAIEAYQAAVRLKPDYGIALNNMGVEYQALGSIRQAEAAFLAALDREPGLADPRFNLGFLYLAQGDTARAAGQHRALAAIDPAAAEELGRFIRAAP